uniref:Uncharacterized protein n=1 Tax=viral metagenome TaxID=1070528 RepID=A0A6M3K174_9ZZZZ
MELIMLKSVKRKELTDIARQKLSDLVQAVVDKKGRYEDVEAFVVGDVFKGYIGTPVRGCINCRHQGTKFSLNSPCRICGPKNEAWEYDPRAARKNN